MHTHTSSLGNIPFKIFATGFRFWAASAPSMSTSFGDCRSAVRMIPAAPARLENSHTTPVRPVGEGGQKQQNTSSSSSNRYKHPGTRGSLTARCDRIEERSGEERITIILNHYYTVFTINFTTILYVVRMYNMSCCAVCRRTVDERIW